MATDEEIRKAIEADDNATYKVPLSLSVPRTDLDKGKFKYNAFFFFFFFKEFKINYFNEILLII